MANKLIRRAFTTREKVLVLLLAIVLVGAFYYFLIAKNFTGTLAYNTEQLAEVEDQIAVQTTIATLRESMQDELDGLETAEGLPEIATYDNVHNAVDELNVILAQTITYNLNFSQPELDGETVRRTVGMTFTTSDYATALAVVEDLQNGRYRCNITDFALNGSLMADGSIASVSATLSVTYFETTRGATSLSGLVEQQDS